MKANLIILLTIIAIVISGCDKKPEENTPACSVELKNEKIFSPALTLSELNELKRVVKETGTAMCCQKYIEHVIENGSDVLKMPAGVMDAGYAQGEDVKKIASYVLSLGNKIPIYPEYLQEGNMFYNGNCGGCHGDDGKGMNGAYPDLTLPVFKGAKIRKERYISKIMKLEKELKERDDVK
ncbi:MAG: hypothetical protein U9P71_00820 [Campylobacterota bacterium]|nr:hypothetical protein [Campylobacterota bacterium]